VWFRALTAGARPARVDSMVRRRHIRVVHRLWRYRPLV